MGEYISLFAKLLMYMIPMGFFLVFVGFFAIEVYIRRKVRGSSLFLFWDNNREMTYELVKTRRQTAVKVGDAKYMIDPHRQGHVKYPFWAPPMMQETIPVYNYRPDEYDPFDPLTIDGRKQRITSKQLDRVSDEAMLTATVKDAREAAEGPTAILKPTSLLVIGLSGLGVFISGVTLYFVWKMSPIIERLSEAVLR